MIEKVMDLYIFFPCMLKVSFSREKQHNVKINQINVSVNSVTVTDLLSYYVFMFIDVLYSQTSVKKEIPNFMQYVES